MISKKEILSPELLFIAGLHLLIFYLASFSMGQISKFHQAEISFLGPILDSFEIDRIQNRSAGTTTPAVLWQGQKESTTANHFLPAKPNLARGIKDKAKNVFKESYSEFETTPIKVAVPVKTTGTATAQPTAQPYQRLRLYQ